MLTIGLVSFVWVALPIALSAHCSCFHCLGRVGSLLRCRFGPYFVEPVIAGLDSKNRPYVASTDLIGCPMETSDFVVGGTSGDQLFGMCESLYKPDMVRSHVFYFLCV